MGITESALRSAALGKLESKKTAPGDPILEELFTPDGNTRVDLALLNGSLTGVEIKSDYDDLRRLQSQAAANALIKVPEGVERLNKGDEIAVQQIGAIGGW